MSTSAHAWWPPSWWPFGPSPAPTPAPAPVPPPSSALTPEAVAAEVNVVRSQGGLPAYAYGDDLASVAQSGADGSAALGILTHGDWAARIASVHFSAAGEDIEEGATTAAGVVALWMSDIPHRMNVMSRAYNRIGVGIATGERGETYVFADFDEP